MLTLGILDLVGDTDLTEGEVVAGTGTIDAEGTVGPIGGIPLKMVAAKGIGAELFLVPADNCAEATGDAEPGFPLAKVATLDDALKALSDFEAGRRPPPADRAADRPARGPVREAVREPERGPVRCPGEPGPPSEHSPAAVLAPLIDD